MEIRNLATGNVLSLYFIEGLHEEERCGAPQVTPTDSTAIHWRPTGSFIGLGYVGYLGAVANESRAITTTKINPA